jgi:hypothetical protein
MSKRSSLGKKNAAKPKPEDLLQQKLIDAAIQGNVEHIQSFMAQGAVCHCFTKQA